MPDDATDGADATQPKPFIPEVLLQRSMPTHAQNGHSLSYGATADHDTPTADDVIGDDGATFDARRYQNESFVP